jgi:hypothetical protein
MISSYPLEISLQFWHFHFSYHYTLSIVSLANVIDHGTLLRIWSLLLLIHLHLAVVLTTVDPMNFQMIFCM